MLVIYSRFSKPINFSFVRRAFRAYNMSMSEKIATKISSSHTRSAPLTKTESNSTACIPMRTVGPIQIVGENINNELIGVPLATFETPLWPSVGRGAKLSRQCGGINVTVVDSCMTRSILLEATSATDAARIASELNTRAVELATVTQQSSNFATLKDWHTQIVGNLLYIRFSFDTGDAAGHNMATKAADALGEWLVARYPTLQYISVSGNYCADKKATAVNGILGRGKYVVAEILVPEEICLATLKTTPAQIVDLNIKKNLLGSIIAGGVRTANAHFANMLLAFYLATGQDAANIVEGSQGFTHTELRDGKDLYFSVTIPSIVVGTVGNGKNLDFVRHNLELLGCLAPRPAGENARRLAAIAGATVLCGEISLLAALTNRGELMRAHTKMERGAE